MSSHPAPAPATSGTQATGLGATTATIGCPASGCSRPTPARFGRLPGGASLAAAIAGTHGYWGSHVGFYGGVPYGYGYTGRGFHGGYWDRDRFMYNRSVTNINTTNITNVYNLSVM